MAVVRDSRLRGNDGGRGGKDGMRPRDAVAAVAAAAGLPRREVYRLWLELKSAGDANMD